MTLKLAPTDIISAELVFKDYVTFRDCQFLSADLLFSFQPFFLSIIKLNKSYFVLNIFLICLSKVLPK